MKLELKNISKKFGNTEVLKNVTITMSGGKIYGFVGRNGSGKSVLLKIICGFYSPSEGIILLNDENYIENNSFPKSTRALIEKPNFLPDLTGLENLKLLASIQNKIDSNNIINTLKELNLESEMNKKYSKYSLGTKQKLGVAQVLMENPNLIILDEPFNGVEEETVEKIRTLLQQEKKKGKIIIIASHIKEDIDILADEVYKVDAGNVKKRSI
ncbi:MAG: ABC transporter ATP-binding protein [Bacilli bacterium]|nr:ABC transporter ATP-binding protein [Bacilli bacterium]